LSDRIGLRVLMEIGTINNLGTTLLERSMPHELTLPQFMVLDRVVHAQQNHTLLSLAETMRVSKATMTSTLQRLVAKGFVISIADEGDRRSKRIMPTHSGYDAYVEATNAITQDLINLQMQIGILHLEAMLPALSTLRTYFENQSQKPKGAERTSLLSIASPL
jgi:DNA-binding MarR family transcriptional regulator